MHRPKKSKLIYINLFLICLRQQLVYSRYQCWWENSAEFWIFFCNLHHLCGLHKQASSWRCHCLDQLKEDDDFPTGSMLGIQDTIQQNRSKGHRIANRFVIEKMYQEISRRPAILSLSSTIAISRNPCDIWLHRTQALFAFRRCFLSPDSSGNFF